MTMCFVSSYQRSSSTALKRSYQTRCSSAQCCLLIANDRPSPTLHSVISRTKWKFEFAGCTEKCIAVPHHRKNTVQNRRLVVFVNLVRALNSCLKYTLKLTLGNNTFPD